MKTNITVKVTFMGGHEMLFGNSYRDWDDQLNEYCSTFNHVPVRIVSSHSPWVSFGGLKWCEPSQLQQQLDDEGKGRKASDFVFGPLPSMQRKKMGPVILNAVQRQADRLTRSTMSK